jgi:hypothetical protein
MYDFIYLSLMNAAVPFVRTSNKQLNCDIARPSIEPLSKPWRQFVRTSQPVGMRARVEIPAAPNGSLYTRSPDFRVTADCLLISVIN